MSINIFSYPSILIKVLGAQNNPLIETVILSTHNISFGREIRKLFLCYALLTKGCTEKDYYIYTNNIGAGQPADQGSLSSTIVTFSSLPASDKFSHLLITFANSLDSDQARQNFVGPDLDRICLTLMVFLIELF